MFILDCILMLFTVIFLLFSVNLFVSPKASKISLFSFIAAILYGDLMWGWLLLQGIVALLYLIFVSEPSEIAQTAGWLLVINWSLLTLHYVLGFTTRAYFQKAMPDVRITSPRLSYTRALRLWPFGVNKQNLIVDRAIEYGTEHLQKLDIYRSQDGVESKPVLLQIHGGGWLEKAGSRREQALPLIDLMSHNGWVVVSIDYQLSPTVAMPEHLIDCKRALAWVKDNIGEYGGNPEQIIVTGGSAGGHLSSLVALTANNGAYQPGFESVDTSVQGCVTFYPVLDMINRNNLWFNNDMAAFLAKTVIQKKPDEAPDLYDAMSPLEQVHADAPPFLVIQGSNDSLVAAREAPLFGLRLDRKSNATSYYVELPFTQHAYDWLITPRSIQTSQAVLAFCNDIIGDQ